MHLRDAAGDGLAHDVSAHGRDAREVPGEAESVIHASAMEPPRYALPMSYDVLLRPANVRALFADDLVPSLLKFADKVVLPQAGEILDLRD
jgi:hypothetical protein